MFTGIVTALGTVRAISPLGTGADMRLTIGAPWPDVAAIPIGASIGCSGCCLTAVEIGTDWFAADASAETLGCTTLGGWQVGTRINLERSFWTEDRRQVIDGLASVGAPPNIFYANGSAFAQLVNSGPETLIYSGIQLLVNNDLANFDTPFFSSDITGTAVSGVPGSLALAPGESSTLAFGAYSPQGYELVTLDIALASAPGDTFFTAAAAVVPEPASGALVLGGLLALAALRMRRR